MPQTASAAPAGPGSPWPPMSPIPGAWRGCSTQRRRPWAEWDILVANAGGVLESKPVLEGDPALWEATVAVNLFGAYHCIRAAIPHLKRRGGGKILTMGSGMGHNGLAGHSAYCCAKAALWMLTRVSARELWADGISVNELVPGPVLTDATRGGGAVAGIDSEWVKSPEDVVPLALFLATQPDVGPTAQSFSLMRRDG